MVVLIHFIARFIKLFWPVQNRVLLNLCWEYYGGRRGFNLSRVLSDFVTDAPRGFRSPSASASRTKTVTKECSLRLLQSFLFHSKFQRFLPAADDSGNRQAQRGRLAQWLARLVYTKTGLAGPFLPHRESRGLTDQARVFFSRRHASKCPEKPRFFPAGGDNRGRRFLRLDHFKGSIRTGTN